MTDYFAEPLCGGIRTECETLQKATDAAIVYSEIPYGVFEYFLNKGCLKRVVVAGHVFIDMEDIEGQEWQTP